MPVHDSFGMEEEATTTPFRVTVNHDEPFRFGQYVTQDVTTTVELTHLVYTPPTSRQAWEEYYRKHPSSSSSAASGASPACGDGVVSVVAKVRSLLIDGQVGQFVIAAFPLDSARVLALDRDQATLDAEPAPAPVTHPTEGMRRFNDVFDVVLPAATDIVSNLGIRLDVDGSLELEVEGPGQVTFFGQQCSQLIPEWKNHHMFRVGAGDEELPEDEEDDDFSEGEMAEMYRLSR